MDERNKLGLVGRVVLAGGALVGGLNSGGCLATATGVAGYYAGKDKARSEAISVENSGHVIPSLPNPKINMERWKDIDGNNDMNNSELFGEIGSSINLRNFGLYVDLGFYSHRIEPVTYTLIDSKGNIIRSEVLFRDSFRINEGSILRPDKYIINAKQENKVVGSINVSREFTILE